MNTLKLESIVLFFFSIISAHLANGFYVQGAENGLTLYHTMVAIICLFTAIITFIGSHD